VCRIICRFGMLHSQFSERRECSMGSYSTDE
jgi:hypothetical protein